MSKSFNLELQARPTKKGTYPIWIRVTENRCHRRIKTSIELNSKKDWNKDKHKVRASEPNYEVWNNELKEKLEEVRREANKEDNEGLSVANFMQSYKEGKRPKSFLDFVAEKLQEVKAGDSVSTYRNYATAMKKLTDYAEAKKLKDITFKDVDVSFLNKFEKYLNELENSREREGKTLKQSTKSKTMRILRTMTKLAVKEGKMEVSPFSDGRYSIKADNATEKTKLEADELQRIMDLELGADSALWHTRNAFLFSFYCAGIRVGDLVQLRWCNVEGDNLSYQMDKTGKVWKNELVEGALEILNYYRSGSNEPSAYIFPFLDSSKPYAAASYQGADTMPQELKKDLFNAVSSRTTIFNRNLKKIAELAEVNKKITAHVSRHSFAHLAMKEGLPDKLTQKLLGHSSVKTTEQYMGNFNSSETSKALKQIFPTKKDDGTSQKETLISALKGLDKETLKEILKGLE